MNVFNEEKPANSTPLITSWSNINWPDVIKRVTKIQQQIFLAEKMFQQEKDLTKKKLLQKRVTKLQRTLIHSKFNLLLSIKKVTYKYLVNRQIHANNFTDSDKFKLFEELKYVNIKLWKPLSINTETVNNNKCINNKRIIKDLILQNVLRNALDPQLEARFKPTAFFRTGHLLADAVSSIFNKVGPRKKRTWVLQITFNLESVNKDFILNQLATFPYLNVLKEYLTKQKLTWNISWKNTCTASLIPLLINLYLNDLDDELDIRYRKTNSQISTGPSLVKWLNQCVIFCSSESEAKNTLQKLESKFCKDRGLNIDTTNIVRITDGFDFEGFNIRLYNADKNNPSGEHKKLLIKPNKSSIKLVTEQIKAIFNKYKAQSLGFILNQINPIIVGFAYSWRHVVSSPAYKYLDWYVDYKIYKHLRRLHIRKSWKWIKSKYYVRDGNAWRVRDPAVPTVIRQLCRNISIKRHVLVTFNNSVYDPELKEYWHKRFECLFNENHAEFKVKLAKRQQYICPHCGCKLYSDGIVGIESLEVNHILPIKFNGTNKYSNLQLMHVSCHINHHRIYKTENDYLQYQQEQKMWYDHIWEKFFKLKET